MSPRRIKPRRRPGPAPILIEAVESRTLLSAAVGPVLHPDAVYLRPALTSTTGITINGLTPAQARHAYGFDAAAFSGGAVAANGAGQTIAVVDAFNDPNIAGDLKVFDDQFGLAPPPSLRVTGQTGGTALPATNAGWAGEIALDVEWAHAIAPAAKILLVEAKSDDLTNLLAGVNYARTVAGVSVVSTSWGGSEFENFSGGEFAQQTALDATLTTPAGHQGVTFVSAAGDSGQQAGVQWPASSPNVLSVGGTTLATDPTTGAYQSETGWSGTSGGTSTVEHEPKYQSAVGATGLRTVPDVAYDADPNTGFAVYDSVPDAGYVGWQEVGGTSAGAPQWAALVAIADQGRAIDNLPTLDGATQTLPALYGLYAAPGTRGYGTYAGTFNDVASGGATAGYTGRHGTRASNGNAAQPGYDLVTGLGTPNAPAVIDALAADAAASGGAGSTGTGGSGTTGGTGSPSSLPLSPVAATFLTAPAQAVVGGQAGSLKLRLTNTAAAPFAGAVTVTLSASTDGTASGDATVVATLKLGRLTLKPLAGRTVGLRFTYPTTLPTGNYDLVASAATAGTDTQPTTAATAPVAVSAPAVDLSVAFATAAVTVTPGKAATTKLRVENLGNVTAAGTVTITLSAVTTDGTTTALVTLPPRRVKVAAGKATLVPVRFTSPADAAAGSYALGATITSATQPSDANAANDTATVPTQA